MQNAEGTAIFLFYYFLTLNIYSLIKKNILEISSNHIKKFFLMLHFQYFSKTSAVDNRPVTMGVLSYFIRITVPVYLKKTQWSTRSLNGVHPVPHVVPPELFFLHFYNSDPALN